MRKIFLVVTLSLIILGFSSGFLFAEEDSFVYDDRGKRDPFVPLVNSKGMIVNIEKDYIISDLHLEGIMAGASGKSIAILNGRIVKIGESVGDFLIKKVDIDSVTLTKGEKEFVLRLKK
ncbi:hypothetical protein MNBD_BACTEROID05-1194 [hydrothermal vent metagenome]|uniref:MSHA biogenesis protein MshK n=1 Tax=hydrothermal vent metagenome TaxID=652676 RepID=A0A3B0TI08_9ZZZZ